MKAIEKELAEQATGIPENPHGLGKLYAGPINRSGMVSDSGAELTPGEAYEHLMNGGCVAIPNAGAGSYRDAFAAMECPKCEVFEWSSSAGDWSFAVFDGMEWHPAFQSNRYPHHGFNYSVDFGWSFGCKEDCFSFMASQ